MNLAMKLALKRLGKALLFNAGPVILLVLYNFVTTDPILAGSITAMLISSVVGAALLAAQKFLEAMGAQQAPNAPPAA